MTLMNMINYDFYPDKLGVICENLNNQRHLRSIFIFNIFYNF